MDDIKHQLRKRRILRSRVGGGLVVPASPLIRLWLLRLLVPLGGHRRFIRDHGFGDDEVSEIVGLGQVEAIKRNSHRGYDFFATRSAFWAARLEALVRNQNA